MAAMQRGGTAVDLSGVRVIFSAPIRGEAAGSANARIVAPEGEKA